MPSMIGAITSTPPRMNRARARALAPRVYASVVVAMMPDEHRPDRKVSLRGTGTDRPATVRRPAWRHQPVATRKATMVTTEAITVDGRISRLPTGPGPVSISGFDSILVSAVYGT